MSAAAPVFDHVGKIFRWNQWMLSAIAADLKDADLGRTPFDGGNDARWVLGHIAIARDYAGHFLGLPKVSPPDWEKRFGAGSSGATGSEGPSKAELMSAIERSSAMLLTALDAADPAAMAKPHGLDFLKDTAMKTVGDFIGFMLTAHESFHIAQLGACRRAAGFKPIF
jgi:hypothetical protein